MNFILNHKTINNTNDKRRLSAIITIATLILVASIIIGKNYKVAYKVTYEGSVLGYVNNKDEFTCMVTNQVLNQNNSNMEIILLNDVPKYTATLVSSKQSTDETSIIKLLKLKADVTYKLYAITLDDKDIAYLDTMEQAQEEVNKLTEQYKGKVESEFGIRKISTNNMLEYKNMKFATTTKLTMTLDSEIKQKEEAAKAEAEAKKAAEAAAKKAAEKKSQSTQNYAYVEAVALSDTSINGIAFTVAPVTGRISSRYGANESIRNHTHKGLDIAASNGTPIYAVADGTVTYASYNSGGYGNLVKISHGNGVETYYAHCSKINVSVGQTVKAGTVVGAVGSTGNSTGNHLHFEIRLNGNYVNPQEYIYKNN